MRAAIITIAFVACGDYADKVGPSPTSEPADTVAPADTDASTEASPTETAVETVAEVVETTPETEVTPDVVEVADEVVEVVEVIEEVEVIEGPPSGTLLWFDRVGGTVGQDQLTSVAWRSDHDLLAGGYLSGTFDLLGSAVEGTNAKSWILQYAPTGASASAHGVGTSTSSLLLQKVAVPAAGGVIVAGDFTHDIDLGGGSQPGAYNDDIFVGAFDDGWAYRWLHVFAGDAVDLLNDLVVAADGRVGITGAFNGTLDYGGGPVTHVNRYDGFGAWLDATGTPLGHIGAASGDDDVMTLDFVPGGVVLGMTFDGTVDFGGVSQTSAGSRDILMGLVSAPGVPSVTKRFGGTGEERVTRVRADAAGNIYLLGSTIGVVDFGGPLVDGTSYGAMVVASFDPTGTHRWTAATIPTAAGGLTVSDMAVDASGDVFVVGATGGTVSFGAAGTPTAGGFIGRLRSDGTWAWVQSVPGAKPIQSVAIDGERVAVAGVCQNATDFLGGTEDCDSNDGFVAVYAK